MIKLREVGLFCVVFCAFAFCGDTLEGVDKKLVSVGAPMPAGFPIKGVLMGKTLSYELHSVSQSAASLTIQIQVSTEQITALRFLEKNDQITTLKSKVLEFFKNNLGLTDSYDVEFLELPKRTSTISIKLSKRQQL